MKIPKHTSIILREMCRRVGAKLFRPGFFRRRDWFLRREWTQAEEDKFVKWMADYLYKNIEARFEIMRCPRKHKESCLKAAKEFTWVYGWKIKRKK